MTGDQIFRIATVIGLPASFVVLLALVRMCRGGEPAGAREAGPPCCGLLRKLVVLGFVLTFAALAVTGLGPNIVTGAKLDGWLLMAHVGGGGAFMFFLLLAALLWGNDCRCAADGAPGRFSDGMKFTFLAMLILGVVTALSIMVSMLPVFSSGGLDVLRDVHRYCAVVYVAVALVHVVLAMRLRRAGRAA